MFKQVNGGARLCNAFGPVSSATSRVLSTQSGIVHLTCFRSPRVDSGSVKVQHMDSHAPRNVILLTSELWVTETVTGSNREKQQIPMVQPGMKESKYQVRWAMRALNTIFYGSNTSQHGLGGGARVQRVCLVYEIRAWNHRQKRPSRQWKHRQKSLHRLRRRHRKGRPRRWSRSRKNQTYW